MTSELPRDRSAKQGDLVERSILGHDRDRCLIHVELIAYTEANGLDRKIGNDEPSAVLPKARCTRKTERARR